MSKTKTTLDKIKQFLVGILVIVGAILVGAITYFSLIVEVFGVPLWSWVGSLIVVVVIGWFWGSFVYEIGGVILAWAEKRRIKEVGKKLRKLRR